MGLKATAAASLRFESLVKTISSGIPGLTREALKLSVPKSRPSTAADADDVKKNRNARRIFHGEDAFWRVGGAIVKCDVCVMRPDGWRCSASRKAFEVDLMQHWVSQRMSRLNEKWNEKETFKLMSESSHKPFQKWWRQWMLQCGFLSWAGWVRALKRCTFLTHDAVQPGVRFQGPLFTRTPLSAAYVAPPRQRRR